MQFGNSDSSAAENVFGKSPTLVFGTGGSSASLTAGNQPTSSTQGQGASTLSFGRVEPHVDATWHPAFTSSSLTLFGGNLFDHIFFVYIV